MGSSRQTLTETGFLADALPCAVPGFARRCRLVFLPRPVPQPARYCLSFTAAGLRPELGAVIAAIHLEEQGDWARTKSGGAGAQCPAGAFRQLGQTA